MHLEMMIEEGGHVFAGSATCFEEVRDRFDWIDFDLALVDIDLADGRTGGEIAAWLHARGRPSLFATGQEGLVRDWAGVTLGTVLKPIASEALLGELSRISAIIDRR